MKVVLDLTKKEIRILNHLIQLGMNKKEENQLLESIPYPEEIKEGALDFKIRWDSVIRNTMVGIKTQCQLYYGIEEYEERFKCRIDLLKSLLKRKYLNLFHNEDEKY